MEARMSICNMSIEAGARAGMIAPDDITFAYLKGRPMAPGGAVWDQAVAFWKTLASDKGARCGSCPPCGLCRARRTDCSATLRPFATW